MKNLFRAILTILKGIGRFFTILRNTFLNILFFLLLVLILVSFLPFESKELPALPPKAVLQLDISGNIVEQKKFLSSFEKLFEDPFFANTKEPQTALQDILDIINEAAQDNNIKVLLLNLKDMGRAGLNQLTTIGEALENFKKTGKPVIAAEDFYTQSQYLLATYASTIIVNPLGGVDVHGMGVFNLYFKEAIDSLKVNYNIFKVGSYKSALEPFTRSDMSPEDKQQNELWLTSLWNIYTKTVNKNRRLRANQLQNYTNNIGEALSAAHGNTSKLAFNSGLVDHVWTRQQIRSHLITLSGANSLKSQIIPSTRYMDQITPSFTLTDSNDHIGLIIAEGPILPGKQPTGFIGGDSLSKQIRKARTDKNIKGLVLRVITGGGSAFASEIIRQELLEFKKSGRPLVVSMGTVTASGGYWIAADADEIWAEDSTITGSIGIFGAIPTFEKSLASLGIYSDGVGTTPLSAGLNLTQPLPPSLKAAIQQTVEFSYEKFLKIVSKGRRIPPRKVGEIAKGRIYDGTVAKSLGLIDKVGGLEKAIEAAAEKANLTDFSTVYIKPPRTIKDQILTFITSLNQYLPKANEHRALGKIYTILHDTLGSYLNLDDPNGVYAFCEINPRL